MPTSASRTAATFAGGHFRARHDAQVVVELGVPEQAVFEALAARVALDDRVVHAGGGDRADLELREAGFLVAR